MPEPEVRRLINVHVVPQLVAPESLRGSTVIVIDVLRATTTIIHALAAGCLSVRPCLEVEEARALAQSLPPDSAILGGERHGKPIHGFHLGNSPGDYSAAACAGKTVIFTTTNGTKAILHAAHADRVLLASFANFSAICEEIEAESRTVNILCAGADGQVAIEDSLLAGSLVVHACGYVDDLDIDDGAWLAMSAHDSYARYLREALDYGKSADGLSSLGYDEDIDLAAQIDVFPIVPELRHDPLRIEIGAVHKVESSWYIP
jgi:2-phosphosulfolactate phosphatase